MKFNPFTPLQDLVHTHFGLRLCYELPVTNNTVYFEKTHNHSEWFVEFNLNDKTISFPQYDTSDRLHQDYQKATYALILRLLLERLAEWPLLGLTVPENTRYTIDVSKTTATNKVVYHLIPTLCPSIDQELTQAQMELTALTIRRMKIENILTPIKTKLFSKRAYSKPLEQELVQEHDKIKKRINDLNETIYLLTNGEYPAERSTIHDLYDQT